MISITRIRARYQESDQMGFIHHSSHIIWFEQSRMDYFRSLGCSLGALENENLIFPVVSIHARYLMPARFDEELVVESAVVEKTRVKVTFHYRLLRENHRLLCAGASTHAFIRKDSHQPQLIPAWLDQKIQIAEAAKIWWNGDRI